MVLSRSQDREQLVIIGEEAAKGIASHTADEWEVRLLSNDEALVETVESDEFESDVVDYEAGDLEETVDDGTTAIVVTDRDRVALLVVQSLNACCDVDEIYVRVDDPQNRHAFEDLDCEILETGEVLRPEVERAVAGE